MDFLKPVVVAATVLSATMAHAGGPVIIEEEGNDALIAAEPSSKIGILPIYIWGTYDAFPKGTIIPKGSSIGAKIGGKVGKFLEYDELAKMVHGVPNTEAYRLIAARVQHEIENMRDGKRDKFDVEAIRKVWKAERRKSRKQEPVIDN